MTEFEQRYAELDEEFHEEYHPSHGGNMTRMVIEKLIKLEDENEQMRKFLGKLYDEERLLGWELQEALGGES